MGEQQQQEPRNNRKNTGNKPNKHSKAKRPSSTSQSKHHKKLEIKFNPTKRVEYLTGFSTRKKERRAFGLAMQKVKDRQAKIDERKDNRDATLEKVEEIERSKAALRYDDDDDNNASDYDDAGEGEKPLHKKNQHTFQDEHTTNHFGGYVSVTTTYGILSDNEEDNDDNDNDGNNNNVKKQSFFERTKHGKDHVDIQQKQAGNVSSYITKVKGSMNSSKKKKHGGASCKKGQHGAASMKGMGSGTTLKMAKKTLAKFKTKGGERERDGGGARGRGKKRKGHR